MKSVGLAVIVGVALWSGTARAQPSALVFEGDATTRDATLAVAAARETLAAAAWKFGDASFTAKEAKAINACMSSAARAPCVNVIIKKKNVARVAILSLENHQTSQGENELVVSARLLVPADNTFAFDQRFCSRCTDDTIASTTKALLQNLLVQIAQDRGRTVLAVNSEPASAGVFVDDETAGVTDLKINISPGHHTVRIERQGYQTELRNVMGVEGKTIALQVKLVRSGAALTVPSPVVEIHPAKPAPHVAPTSELAVQPSVPEPVRPAPQATPSRLWPGVLLGSGVTLLGVGAYDLWRGSGDSARYHYPNATTIGVGAGIVGAGLAVTGIYWWLHRSKSTTAPTAYLDAHGAVLGWAGTF